MAFWYFVRCGPGRLKQVPLRTMEAFFRCRMRLQAEPDGYLRYVGLAIEQRGRTALGIERVWFARCRLRQDGTLDEEHLIQVASARRKLRRGDAQLARSDGAVIDARALFDLRRIENQGGWEPDDRELLALRALVNRRAGWEML